MVRYKKKLPTKSPRAAVTAAPPSAGDQSLGSVSRSTRSQQRLQNDDTASLSASARTVAVAIADGDISEKSNEDDRIRIGGKVGRRIVMEYLSMKEIHLQDVLIPHCGEWLM